MPKTPYPYSSQITAKTIKDWQHIDFNLIRESSFPDETWKTLTARFNGGPNYSLKYRVWSEDYLGHPEELGSEVTFEDKEKIGEKLIEPYLTWKYEEDNKKRKAEEKKQKREHLKKIKDFLKP